MPIWSVPVGEEGRCRMVPRHVTRPKPDVAAGAQRSHKSCVEYLGIDEKPLRQSAMEPGVFAESQFAGVLGSSDDNDCHSNS